MRLWDASALPAAETMALAIDAEGQIDIATSGGAVGPDYDLVWRRRVFPHKVAAELPPGDRRIAERESRALIEAALALLAPQAHWVNPVEAGRVAQLKPAQLRAAARAGLRIPSTLCSNDPDEIRRFAERHRGRIVHKPFYPAVWRDDTIQYVAETACIEPALLANDFALQAAPGIYQPLIDKQYELRVTFMGQASLAAKLTLAGSVLLPTDIKPVSPQLTAVKVDLPEEIRRKCLCVMADLGIVFGCFDLIVTPSGEVVFLEVNQAGQFLWLETLNYEIPMLSLFTDFISSGQPDFAGPARRDGISWAAFEQSACYRKFAAADYSADADRLRNFVVPEPARS